MNFKKYILSTTLIFGFLFTATAQTTSEFFKKSDVFFSKYVKSGKVDYKSIKADDASLSELIGMAEKITVTKGNQNEYQAFWINAYNLNVIKSVVENYPIKSPLNKAGFFDGIKHNVGGKKITLNNMEHKMLRAVFPKESRFHFVLVCAGLGCPPIISKAYLPNTLETQLQEQTEKALNDSNFVRINKNKVKLSQIFDWYKKDFTQGGKSLVEYVNQFRKEKLPENAKVGYYAYDWTLNQQ